ncbi:MAG: pentapeptide repeat-containing protein [Akkermansiaceae bacterium]
MPSQNKELKLTQGSEVRNFFRTLGEVADFDEQKDFQKELSEMDKIGEMTNRLYMPETLKSSKSFSKIENKTFKNVSFSKTEVSQFTFTDCKFVDCLFIGSTFRNCEFHHCVFENCNFFKAAFDACYIDPRSFSKVLNLDRRTYSNIGVGLFKNLSLNSLRENQHEFRAEAEFMFSYFKRLALYRDRETRKIGSFKFLAKYAWAFFLQLSSGFGWRPLRVAGSLCVGFLLLFALNHSLWLYYGMKHSSSGLDVNREIHTSFYYTASLITTLGHSNFWATSNFGIVTAGLQSIIGVLFFAVAASIFFRFLVKR